MYINGIRIWVYSFTLPQFDRRCCIRLNWTWRSWTRKMVTPWWIYQRTGKLLGHEVLSLDQEQPFLWQSASRAQHALFSGVLQGLRPSRQSLRCHRRRVWLCGLVYVVPRASSLSNTFLQQYSPHPCTRLLCWIWRQFVVVWKTKKPGCLRDKCMLGFSSLAQE